MSNINKHNADNPQVPKAQSDLRKFEAVGNYRSGLGQTFVSTQHQFDEWKAETSRIAEFDELAVFDSTNRVPKEMFLLEEGEDVQGKFDAIKLVELKKLIDAKFIEHHCIRQSSCGDRQLGNKRKSKEKRRWRRDVA